MLHLKWQVCLCEKAWIVEMEEGGIKCSRNQVENNSRYGLQCTAQLLVAMEVL